MENLGNCLMSQGRVAEAEETLRLSTADLERVDGMQSAAAIQGRACLATVLGRQDSISAVHEALTLTSGVAVSLRRIHGAADPKATEAARYVEKLEAKLSRMALSEGAAAAIADMANRQPASLAESLPAVRLD
uniref:Uncharacterized protein n=1 Tax=Haptolina brevifila TaxID=156173 RepID=A0A7S2GS22_9EUKA